ncbi:MAG: hypothetical protein R2710_08610 [Acidimicrobiales bacterium]
MSIDLEERLAEVLSAGAESITPAPMNPARPHELARRRRRRRRGAGAGLAAVALLGAGVTASALRDSDQVEIAADGGDSTTSTSQVGSDAVGSTTGDQQTDLPTSTGPALAWTEVELAPAMADGFSQAVWTGSGFLAMVSGMEQSLLFTSADGATWTELASPLPEGVAISGLWASNTTALVWGDIWSTDGSATSAGPTSTVLYRSDDGGSTWRSAGELALNEADADPTDRATVVRYVTGAAALGDRVVLSVGTSAELDIPTILGDLGYDLSDDGSGAGAVYGTETDQNGVVTVVYCPSSGASVSDGSCPDEIRLSADELGLTPGEASLADTIGSGGQTSFAVAEDGGDFELVEAPVQGWPGQLAVSADRVLTQLWSESGSAVLASTDGRTWTQERPLGDAEVNQLVNVGNRLVVTGYGEQGLVRASSDDGGRTWQPIDGLPSEVSDLVGGPAGFVATGMSGVADAVQELVIKKDGYWVTLGETVRVVEIASGDTVLEFGPEVTSGDEMPPEVIENEGPPWTLTFLDPETGEELVTVDEDDLNRAGYDDGSDAPSGTIVGYSADGTAWGWQTVTDAFGVDGWPMIAVGEQSVVAIVTPDSDGSAAQPGTRYFVASVPD